MSEEVDIIQNVTSSIEKVTYEEEIFLSECWTLYFHDPDDNEWTPNSYKVVNNFSTVQDWCYTDLSFTTLWQKGMFFAARRNLFTPALPHGTSIANK